MTRATIAKILQVHGIAEFEIIEDCVLHTIRIVLKTNPPDLLVMDLDDQCPVGAVLKFEIEIESEVQKQIGGYAP